MRRTTFFVTEPVFIQAAVGSPGVLQRAWEKKKESVDSVKRKNELLLLTCSGLLPPPVPQTRGISSASCLTDHARSKALAVTQTSLSSPFGPSRELIEAIRDQVTTPACQTQAEERQEAWLAWLFKKPGRIFSTHPLWFLFLLIYDVYLGTSA